jgi:transcriptional regulator with GAF, ATPase, and Fis domain
MQPAMATKKPRSATAKPTTPRKKSKLTAAGDRAKWETERALLLETLDAHGWNLTHTAEALAMGHPSAVLRALKHYDLRDAYEKHRAG